MGDMENSKIKDDPKLKK